MSYSYLPITQRPGMFTGYKHAFNASGGYTVDQGFSQIRLLSQHITYDVTDSVQVYFSATTLNSKLGILKDASGRVVQALIDASDNLQYDTLNLSSSDYINGINTESVVSVGRLQYVYNDFISTVSSYFGDPNGFASLFLDSTTFDVNGGVFDASAYIQVVNSSKFTMTGSFVSDLSGAVTVKNINDTLEYLLDSNIFENRPHTFPPSYKVEDGFLAGDLVFIPTGFTIKLSLDIQSEFTPEAQNTGTRNLDEIVEQLNWTTGYIKRSTAYSSTNITQTTTLPILLVLVDDVVAVNENYGQTWIIASNVVYNGILSNPIKPWVAISISTDGKYQTSITDAGDIYISTNYGDTRSVLYNIGISPCNSIAISFTGQYQTASNGHNIYVSNNYGSTWNQTFSGGNTNIFVSISLTGKYQTLVSSGENVFRSNNFGYTWTQLDITVPNQNDLFQSVQAFPTSGLALSYNGQYQTIVSQYIFVSSDYANTWTNVTFSNGLDDRNWQSLTMSSDGKYQFAIENGGDVYMSSDYGITWSVIEDPLIMSKQWVSISCSASGQYITSLENNGNIYISSDYGLSWTRVADTNVSDSKDWRSISVSSDGLYQCAIEYSGQVYMSKMI
jgi:photosystem II stability/assembly factor-like uncharacterized protein